MSNKAKILYGNQLAGYLEKTDSGFSFYYDQGYLKTEGAMPVSQTLPLTPYVQTSRVLFSFFDGLIPEGWLLNIASKHWKIEKTNRFDLLLTLCRDTIGAVTVQPIEEKENV